jgi:hypothetical protein
MDRQDIASRLPPELRAEYIALSRMFESEGWRFYMTRVLAEHEASRQRKEHASSWDANRVAHGEVHAYFMTICTEESVDAEYISMIDELESGEDD